MNTESRILLRTRVAQGVTDAFAPWQTAGPERWLFVSPHDDDVLIGAGLWVQSLLAAQATLGVAIVTDGRMGYSDAGTRDTVVARRQAEAKSAYGLLGLSNDAITHLGFPDGSLAQHAGSRLEAEKPAGLECSLTRLLREFRPTRVVTADPADWHPDHVTTFHGVRMSVFHACGDIWSDLGQPLATPPALYAFSVYAPLESEPDFLIEGASTAVTLKIAALSEFKSQAGVINQAVSTAGLEYLRHVPTSPHDPGDYRSLFPA